MKKMNKPAYSTWIRKKKIALFWILSVSIVALGAMGSLLFLPLGLICLFAAPFLYIAFVISLAAYRFGVHGGDFQNKIHKSLTGFLTPTGRVLDVGCGSGNLIIKIAKENRSNHVGLDFWGSDWEYSRNQCVQNAQLEGVEGIDFKKGSASKLPFESDSFENVVSCLTFHEVRDVQDKTKPVKEAIRVLKPDGRFAFFDLFNDPQHFGSLDSVKKTIEHNQGKIEITTEYSKMENLPFPLNTPKVLKYAVLITGLKKS